MKHLLTIALLLVAVSLVGCQRGDVKVDVVFKGQAAPFSGYNVGPELYVPQGSPIPVSGILVWLKNLDPNDLLEGY